MKYVRCNLCSADNWQVIYPSTLRSATKHPQVEAFLCTNAYYGAHTQIVRCHECGHIYANPTWETSDLLDAYTHVQDEMYVAEREGRQLTFRHHLQILEQFTGSADGRSLLDVGAYIGVFVEVARANGWNAWGIEPSQWAVEVARKQQLPVLLGTTDSPMLANCRFDVVTLWDVIEHLDDPLAELQRVSQLLKPGGWIAVHTMDIESVTARLMGKHWPWLMEMHVHFFSKRTLSQFLRAAGFEVVRVQTEGRYLRLGYVASRLAGLNGGIGRIFGSLIDKAQLAALPIPINSGDLFTAYARKLG